MKNLDVDQLKQIEGGKTVNQDEFHDMGRQLGKATREALETIGILLLFLR